MTDIVRRRPLSSDGSLKKTRKTRQSMQGRAAPRRATRRASAWQAGVATRVWGRARCVAAMALRQLCAGAGGRTLSEFEAELDASTRSLLARFQQSGTNNDEDAREPLTPRDEEKMEGSSGEDEDTEIAAAFAQSSSPGSEPSAACPPPLKRKGSKRKPPRKRAKTPDVVGGLSAGLSTVAVSPAPAPRVSPRGSPRGGDEQGDLLVQIRDAAEKMKQALTCRACDDWFDEPITLRCGHNMCRACAQEQTKCLKRGPERTSRGLRNSACRPSPSRHMMSLTLFDVAGAASQSSAAMRRGAPWRPTWHASWRPRGCAAR